MAAEKLAGFFRARCDRIGGMNTPSWPGHITVAVPASGGGGYIGIPIWPIVLASGLLIVGAWLVIVNFSCQLAKHSN